MFRATRGISLIVTLGLFIAAIPLSNQSSQAAKVAPRPLVKPFDPLPTSAIYALLAVNDGKPPATGDQLWKSLVKIGNFAQLPIVFSAVKLDSTLSNPRVVIAHLASRISAADANKPNLVGRLFLVANMEKPPKGDPRVTSVEFISWNTARRQFDFGLIENMGGEGKPEFRIVDGGRCFACHKNRGPILGEAPWTNSVLHPIMRNLVAGKLNIVSQIPPNSPPATRNRIDGMALVSPEAVAVDVAVGLGRELRNYREVFRLMNRSPAGRQAFLALLEGILEQGVLEGGNAEIKRRVNAWETDPSESFFHFQNDVRELLKTSNSGVLNDFAGFNKNMPKGGLWGSSHQHTYSSPMTGFRSLSDALQVQINAFRTSVNKAALQVAKANAIVEYDNSRSEGKPDMPSTALPSNPKAFSSKIPAFPRSPSGMVNTFLLADTIGLTEGDRFFMTKALDEGAGQFLENVSTKSLARAVFEGPEFADVLAGGPLPDRDDFKDRFVAGLDKLLKTKYMSKSGFNPNRRDYAYGPRREQNAAAEVEVAIVPKTACLRCHEAGTAGKARSFELIPALSFDPLDANAREMWMKLTPKERKQDILSLLQKRLFKDADMPPKDSPEHELFRIRDAAAFDKLKTFLEAELANLKKPR